MNTPKVLRLGVGAVLTVIFIIMLMPTMIFLPTDTLSETISNVEARAETGNGRVLPFPSNVGQLDFTPVATVNLPLVIKNPPPTNTPTPTPAPVASNPTFGSGGLAPGNYVTTVAGLQASVVVSDNYDPQTPTYLSFHVHGDVSAWWVFGNKPNNDVTKFINDQGWIFVAPESPNGGQSWWDNENGDHRQALADVLDEMFASYNVCRDTVIGSAGSGGSEFWTRMFFPRKGGQYPAHMLINCGGNDVNGNAADLQRVQEFGDDPAINARTSLYFLYGSEDSLVPLIEQSIDMYTEAGFDVTVDKLEGAGHCNKWKDEGLPTYYEQITLKWTIIKDKLGI